MVVTPNIYNVYLGDLENSFKQRDLVHFTKGNFIPCLRDHVWIVVRGLVNLSCLNEQGEDVLIALIGPSEPFGEPMTDLDLVEPKALTDCDLLCLSMQEVIEKPNLTLSMMKALIRRNQQSEAIISILGLRGVENRVQSFLELIAKDYGHPCTQGIKLNLRLRHQDIANALGTTRVTITKVLGCLKEKGWLSIDHNQYITISHLPKKSDRS